ncbi:hypothetical protein PCASD_05097 [Puccinia coronata f. sp. avenae]|uniref:Uncharacterized protein n=1 Tax=Puccinia coronata f. sp. avenae TaxID=200324 RepID=A0A2N5VG94_9BASI|nr:hypothetical protein PCASD_05097 [Puccinia coronata f. sp. avenae]
MSEPTGNAFHHLTISNQSNDLDFSVLLQDRMMEAINGLVRGLPQKGCCHRRREWRGDPLPITPAERSARKETLILIQTSLLPSVKRQLMDLLTSFGLIGTDDNTSQKNSRRPLAPRFDDALDILSQFGPAMHHIQSAIFSLSPWGFRDPHSSVNDIDADYGVLKKFRCDHLLEHFGLLINSDSTDPRESDDLRGLFHHYHCYVPYMMSAQLSPNYHDPASDFKDEPTKSKLKDLIIHKTALWCRQVDDMIERSTQSDLGFLQADWRRHVNHLNELLPRLAPPIKALNERRLVSYPANRNLIDPPSKIRALINSLVLQLFDRSITIIKLIRIFFSKLLDTPSRKTPIRLGDELTSDQLSQLQWKLQVMLESVVDIADSFFGIQQEYTITFRILDYLKEVANQMLRNMEQALLLLADFMRPAKSSPSVNPPSSSSSRKALYDSLFADFVPQFYQTFHHFQRDVSAVTTHLEQLRRLIRQPISELDLRFHVS